MKKALIMALIIFLVSCCGCSRDDQDIAIPNDEITAVNEILKSKTYYYNESDIRKFPYPYKSMLSITSDIDDATVSEFETYHRFLNTKEETTNGTGLGLDVGDSFWVYMGAKKKIDGKIVTQDYVMTLFSGIDFTKPKDDTKIKKYFDCGWIDSIHSFGDFSRYTSQNKEIPTRELASEAWSALKKYDIQPLIWICHGDDANIDNFGGYTPKRVTKYQQGDDPKSFAYHTDITIANGVKYVWNGLESDQFGRDNPLFQITLRDGQKIWGFKRFTNLYSPNDFIWLWSPSNIDKQITKKNLEDIVTKGQYSIIATHFGTYKDYFPFDQNGIKALRMLAEYNHSGKVLVARTSRLLNYCIAQNYIKYFVIDYEGKTYIDCKSIDDPIFGSSPVTLNKVRGINFHVKDPATTIILIRGVPVPQEEIIYGQEGDEKIIGIKWYNPDYTDYSN